MVNIEGFVKRLEIVLDYYGLSASAFADKIGVQRSSLSHLLSGRNKPSLDLILKIIQNFPEIDLYWIVNGKGTFPIPDSQNEKITNLSQPPIAISSENKIDTNSNLFSQDFDTSKNPVFENIKNNFSNTGNMEGLKNEPEIDRIVVFFKNGSFKNYLPE